MAFTYEVRQGYGSGGISAMIDALAAAKKQGGVVSLRHIMGAWTKAQKVRLIQNMKTNKAGDRAESKVGEVKQKIQQQMQLQEQRSAGDSDRIAELEVLVEESQQQMQLQEQGSASDSGRIAELEMLVETTQQQLKEQDQCATGKMTLLEQQLYDSKLQLDIERQTNVDGKLSVAKTEVLNVELKTQLQTTQALLSNEQQCSAKDKGHIGSLEERLRQIDQQPNSITYETKIEKLEQQVAKASGAYSNH